MTHKKALILVQQYIYNLQKLSKITTHLFMQDFCQISYEKWAANELYDYIRKYPLRSPVATTEEFIAKMGMMACDPGETYMFSVAEDTAVDILDVLLFSK